MTALLPLCIVLAYALAWGVAERIGDVLQRRQPYPPVGQFSQRNGGGA